MQREKIVKQNEEYYWEAQTAKRELAEAKAEINREVRDLKSQSYHDKAMRLIAENKEKKVVTSLRLKKLEVTILRESIE